jgi:hypothetical protein
MDIADKQPELVKKMAAAYEQWWSDLYPVMIERGGDVELAEVAKKRVESTQKKNAAPMPN